MCYSVCVDGYLYIHILWYAGWMDWLKCTITTTSEGTVSMSAQTQIISVQPAESLVSWWKYNYLKLKFSRTKVMDYNASDMDFCCKLALNSWRHGLVTHLIITISMACVQFFSKIICWQCNGIKYSFAVMCDVCWEQCWNSLPGMYNARNTTKNGESGMSCGVSMYTSGKMWPLVSGLPRTERTLFFFCSY